MAMTDGKPAGGKPASVKAGGKPAGVKSDLKPADHLKPANSDNWVARGYEARDVMKPKMLRSP
jgi:hypothetical protein